MSYFFISGYLRSGTTLLEKLLCNHPSLSVLSQPLPELFIEVKRKFLTTKDIHDYFVLSNYVQENRYTYSQFLNYLSLNAYSHDYVTNIVGKGYSGQLCQVSLPAFDGEFSLADIYSSVVENNRHNRNAALFGSKEVLCEEYVQYLLDNDIKVIHIVRDPKDVIASAKKGKGAEYTGKIKPTLFELRNWRKSAQVAIQLAEHELFLAVRYEDLVSEPVMTLENMTEFLGCSRFPDDAFSNGIMDQQGNVWSSNSSFSVGSGISKSAVGRHKTLLSEELQSYIDTICYPELSLLGYECRNLDNFSEIIRNFREEISVSDNNVLSDYSSTNDNVDYEVDRITQFLSGDLKFEFKL
jgi:hypothetical protein